MFGLLTRLISGAITPLADQFSDFSARLLRKLALFFVAGLCLTVVLIALTIAFDLWIASRAGPIVGALAVAGLYFAIAGAAIVLALRKDTPTPGLSKDETAAEAKAARASVVHNHQIDEFAAPLLALLERLGLRREQLAVLAGASVAKQIGPLPLVGLAILAGFLIGRWATGWRSLMSLDLLTDVFSSGLFGERPAPAAED